jgi:hypothetical protein
MRRPSRGGLLRAADRIGEIVRAKAICASCPVADDCLAFGIETNQPDGIWGGYTAEGADRDPPAMAGGRCRAVAS